MALANRLPWNDSRVVGSPDPLSPYKVVKAFPNLSIKQPLTMAPEPGRNRLFIVQHMNVWAGPGRVLAVRDDQTASEAEMLLEVNGLAVGMAFHPNYEKQWLHLHRYEWSDRRSKENHSGGAVHRGPQEPRPD